MLKIVTYNLRWDAPEDGIHRFSNRIEEVMDRIKEEFPDVIAFQEMRADMQEWMEPRMAEYVFVGHGRDADFNGESIPIAFLLGSPKTLCVVKACNSNNKGLVPSILATTTDPEGFPSLSEIKSSDGFFTSTKPSFCISNIPISLVEPNLFFTVLKIL